MTEPAVTRREIDLLKAEADIEHARLAQAIASLDEHGSRGVGSLQTRMDSLVASMAELKADMRLRFDGHDREHERDERARVASRRWLVGAVIGGIAAVDGPLVTILLARGR